jgi:signal transduction histidine kinase
MGLGEAERLEHMIENVLIAGRLRTDRQPIRMSLSRLDRFLDAFAAHRGELIQEPGALEVACEEGVRDAEALFDPDGLRVVLENLVDNALKYGGDEPNVRIHARKDGSALLVDVADDGIGFDPGEAENLFRPFVRTTEEGSPSRHGAGLGLSIARALMRRMGGDVTARSDGPGRGACFTVHLPGRPG